MCYKDKSPAMDPCSTSFTLIRILTDADTSTHDRDPGNRIPHNVSLESLGSSGFWDLVFNGETVRKTPRNIARTPTQKIPAQPLVMNLRKRARKSVIVGLPAPSRFPGSYQSDVSQTCEDLQNLQPSIRVSRMASERPRPHLSQMQCGKERLPPNEASRPRCQPSQQPAQGKRFQPRKGLSSLMIGGGHRSLIGEQREGNMEVENLDFSRVDKSSKATSDQNCQPSGRMRGSLSGRAYASALSQYIIQPTQVTSPSAIRDPLVNPFSTPSGSTGAAEILYRHAPTLANQPTQIDAEVCVEPEVGSCESEQENTDGVRGLRVQNLPTRVQAEMETEDEAAKPGLCRIIRDDDEAKRKKKKKKVAREELGLSCQSGLTTEHLSKTNDNVEQVILITNRDGSFMSMENINHVPNEVESILGKRTFSSLFKTEKPEKHHSVKVVQERFVCRACNQEGHMRTNKSCPMYGNGLDTQINPTNNQPMQVDAEECQEAEAVNPSTTKNARENFVCGACGQEGHMKTNKNCPRYGHEADIQVVESSGTESLSEKRDHRNSVNCIKDMQEIVKGYMRKAREDEKPDILRVEQAAKAAHEKLVVASWKRKQAQTLMEYADLVAERATMALKIAQAARLSESSDVAASSYLDN
ncbi:hypothetical protein C5167_026005 [Papaver somniferum]|uniref:uncharacterized protein LOC113344163 n=1 Tax=Papaver somniferum TaxID=3469 RepID=UPI000E70568C|nr:uncharacterized protein LOC113344163 [Papaver somniferum]RZC93391.1 hypothetical protein C5167_026005 [Papaver somniferum]